MLPNCLIWIISPNLGVIDFTQGPRFVLPSSSIKLKQTNYKTKLEKLFNVATLEREKKSSDPSSLPSGVLKWDLSLNKQARIYAHLSSSGLGVVLPTLTCQSNYKFKALFWRKKARKIFRLCYLTLFSPSMRFLGKSQFLEVFQVKCFFLIHLLFW